MIKSLETLCPSGVFNTCTEIYMKILGVVGRRGRGFSRELGQTKLDELKVTMENIYGGEGEGRRSAGELEKENWN